MLLLRSDHTDRSPIYHRLVNGKLIPNERDKREKVRRSFCSAISFFPVFSSTRIAPALFARNTAYHACNTLSYFSIPISLLPRVSRFLPSFFVHCVPLPRSVPSLLPQAPSFNLPHTVLLFFFSFYICTNTCIYSSTIECIHTRAHARARVRRVLECAFV